MVVDIGVLFYDYMLIVLGSYVSFDFIVCVIGDVEIEVYYIIEDMVIVLGIVFG